jgi:hypothetical protein
VARGKYSKRQRQFDVALRNVLELDESCTRRQLEDKVRILVEESEKMSLAFREVRQPKPLPLLRPGFVDELAKHARLGQVYEICVDDSRALLKLIDHLERKHNEDSSSNRPGQVPSRSSDEVDASPDEEGDEKLVIRANGQERFRC